MIEENESTPDELIAVLPVVKTALQALEIDKALCVKEKTQPVDIVAMVSPGTVVWRDPSTQETRYTKPGDRMYSTALMFAESIIGGDGQPQEL